MEICWRLMKKFFSAIVVAITLFLLSTCCVLAQQPNNNSPNVKDDSLRRTIDEIKELLVKHYDPMIPIANYQPSVKARFEPIEFNSCDLWWKLIAPLSKNSSYVLDIHMNLADLNPNSVVVSADLKRKNRWFISLQTLNMTPKIKVKRVTLNGA